MSMNEFDENTSLQSPLGYVILFVINLILGPQANRNSLITLIYYLVFNF